MAALEDHKGGGQEEKGFDRILALSDGVFAFSITLLVLDLTVPVVATGPAESAMLLQQLEAEWVGFLSYFLSFFIVGLYWFSHHRYFRYIRRYNNSLMWINLVLLLFITLVPFMTRLLSEYEYVTIAVQLYALDQAAAGYSGTVLWIYASHNRRLVDRNLSSRFVRYITIRSMLFPTIFVVSALAAFVIPSYATLFWFGTLAAWFLLGRVYKNED